MKSTRTLTLATLLILAMSALAWGQTSPLDQLPTPEEVGPLREEALQVVAGIFNDPDSIEGDHLGAMFVIEKTNHPIVIPLLIEVLQNDRFASVRRAAARELGDLRAVEALPALRKAVDNETLASLRWVAGMSILQMRPLETELLEALLADVDILAEAALALQDSAVASEFPPSLIPQLVKAFVVAVQDRENYNSVERAAMMQTLASFDVTEAIDVILGIMNDETEESFVRGSAAFVLGELGAIETLPDIIAHVEAGDPGIQLGAVSAFGMLKDPAALDALVNLVNLQETSPSVRMGAATSLASYGESGLDALIHTLNNDPVPDVRAEAVRSLTEIGTDGAKQAIIEFFATDYLITCDPFACATLALEAMYSLALFGEGELALELLQGSLEQLEQFLPFVFAFQEADLVRVATAIGRANEALFDILINSDNPFVQFIGIAALANVKGREAREQLLTFINPEENRLVSRAALEGLEKIAVADDVTIFAEWTTDGDRRSRLAAFNALIRVGDERALPVIQDALFVEDLSTSLQAAEASFLYANRIDELFDAVDQIDPANGNPSDPGGLSSY